MSAHRTVRIPSYIPELPQLETEFTVLPEEAKDILMIRTGCSTSCIHMTPDQVSALVDALAPGLRENFEHVVNLLEAAADKCRTVDIEGERFDLLAEVERV